MSSNNYIEIERDHNATPKPYLNASVWKIRERDADSDELVLALHELRGSLEDAVRWVNENGPTVEYGLEIIL
jgi:hypothetical protein